MKRAGKRRRSRPLLVAGAGAASIVFTACTAERHTAKEPQRIGPVTVDSVAPVPETPESPTWTMDPMHNRIGPPVTSNTPLPTPEPEVTAQSVQTPPPRRIGPPVRPTEPIPVKTKRPRRIGPPPIRIGPPVEDDEL